MAQLTIQQPSNNNVRFIATSTLLAVVGIAFGLFYTADFGDEISSHMQDMVLVDSQTS